MTAHLTLWNMKKSLTFTYFTILLFIVEVRGLFLESHFDKQVEILDLILILKYMLCSKFSH